MTRSKQRQRKKRPAVQVRDAPGCAAFSGAYLARVTMPSRSCRRRQPEDVLTKCWQLLA